MRILSFVLSVVTGFFTFASAQTTTVILPTTKTFEVGPRQERKSDEQVYLELRPTIEAPRKTASPGKGKLIVSSEDDYAVKTFMQDLIALSNDIALKYRGAHRLSDKGTLYINRDVMYRPAGRNYAYGIATVHHNTGPAIRYRW